MIAAPIDTASEATNEATSEATDMSTAIYSHPDCRRVLRHAQGCIVSCLEGGYNLSARGRSLVAHVKALAELD
jgi:acetoin utilization deacetylase AcuC-like enzyme